MGKKTKTYFVCNNCGEDYPRWHGRCNNCGEWDSIKEFRKPHDKKTYSGSGLLSGGKRQEPVELSSCNASKTERMKTGFPEMDRALGGGIVPGSVVLIGGNPGVGKSTLMLHIASLTDKNNSGVLYVSGEESLEQLYIRSTRLGLENDKVNVLQETSVERILDIAEEKKPSVIIIDSIQTSFSENLESTPGTVSQVRECTSLLLRYAKNTRTAMFLIGHVTKDGAIAGPRMLEHIVDTVLYFEGDSNYHHRILRTVKNRFGPSGEIALFSMSDTGLKEVKNTSEFFLMHRNTPQVGTAVVPVLEGSRILVIELQSLVNQTHFGLPQRVASGINPKKLSLLIAVLERYTGINLGDHDIFFNIAGGISVSEPAADLGIAAAIISSFRNLPVRKNIAFTGELGLGGEIRPVNSMAARIKALSGLGFSGCVVPVPKKGSSWAKLKTSTRLITCASLKDIPDIIF